MPAGGRGETRTVFGIEWSLLTLDGLRHLILPALTLGIYKASLIARLAYAGTRETLAGGFRALSQRQGPSHQAASSASTCSRTS